MQVTIEERELLRLVILITITFVVLLGIIMGYLGWAKWIHLEHEKSRLKAVGYGMTWPSNPKIKPKKRRK